MKKFNRMLAVMLAVVGIAVMLPMGSVQALKKAVLLERESEVEQERMSEEFSIGGEDAMNELVPHPKEEKAQEHEAEKASASQTEACFETTHTKTAEEMTEAVTEKIAGEITEEVETETEQGEEAVKESVGIAQKEESESRLTVKIKDSIGKSIVYKNDEYVKEARHTVTLTGGKSTAFDAYESFSYVIYEKTDEGTVISEQGLLGLPEEGSKSAESIIETEYTHAGSYCIKIMASLKVGESDNVELASHDFSVKKERQSLSVKKNTISLCYGERIYSDDLLKTTQNASACGALEIREESGENGKILEIGSGQERVYIKAIGMNAAEEGITTVILKRKETPLLEASPEKELTVRVNPIALRMEMQTDVSKVYMYDTLAVKITLKKDEKNVTKEVLESEEGLCINFCITSGTGSCQVNSTNLKSEQDNSYIFYIPVKKEYFKEFSKGTTYSITAALRYKDEEKEFIPYQVHSVEEKLELLGRRAELSLSADNGGSYDYRGYYNGGCSFLNIAIQDTTKPLDEEEAGSNALLEETESIVYSISSTNEHVAAADGTKQYTAKDRNIPLCINGVGTATLTVEAAGSSVYTVKKAVITIKVGDSPLCDEDFVIGIVDDNGVPKQSFAADENETGFQKWQQYLTAHDGWLNDKVRIDLTENGTQYYQRLCLARDGRFIGGAPQLDIDCDTAMAEYTLWAVNDSTNADTHKAGENGTRSFKLGIDSTAPEIKDFFVPADYYTATGTETRQYFAEDFVLTGSFADATSGIAAIEYTTDMNAQDGARWELLEDFTKFTQKRAFTLVLANGFYPAIAVRAIDAAGNISEPVCLKNENGDFIQIIVDDTPPVVRVSMMSDGKEYNAENECWTNQEITFCISEKPDAVENGEQLADARAGLYRVEYAYKSIGAVICGEPIAADAWQELILDENGTAVYSVGGSKKPVNQNGFYYFRGVSKAGVKSTENTEKRILLWQDMAPKKPVIQTGAVPEKRYNEWYNKQSGTPVIDFSYPEYDTGVISGEYAAPITIHYLLKVTDEKDITTILVADNTATIRTFVEAEEFTTESDDISQMQVLLTEDGIYTLEYWITDAAGNRSEVESLTYKIDCHEPTDLRLVVNDEELALGKESTLVYDRFYQSSITGSASAEFGISKKESITLLKAKQIGEWDDILPNCDAEQFSIEPNMRCLLYIRAVDGAGNVAEGWTRGIVVDNEAPVGEGGQEMIIEPQGANKHGFFHQDVKVHIDIKDAPTDKNCAALKLVTSSVGVNGIDTISDKELFSSPEEGVSETRIEETESFTVIETIDAKENEGNAAYITVKAADRSGNMSTYTKELKIDVTKPEIEISFDNENAVNGRYYNADRRAKISIKELNFDASLVEITAKRNGEQYTPAISDWHREKDEHYAYISFTADGDYTLEAGCTDLADNEAEKVSAEPFTIDKTMPQVEIALENREAVNAQEGYFNTAQTAVITVTEHNFNAKDFRIRVQPAGKVSTWEHKNDTHVIRVELLTEGAYEIFCDYQDLAGNAIADKDKAKMPLELVVDRTSPGIEITGVEDNSANAGEVVPLITVLDRNMEQSAATVTLTTGRGTAVDISADITAASVEGGFVYSLNGLAAKQDDVYYLTVNAADKAGNTSKLTYRFSLNRRGSAYDLTDLAGLTKQYYSSYQRFEDLTIVEMNVDRVEDFELYMSYNTDVVYGAVGRRPVCPSADSLPRVMLYDVKVSGNENIGYTYTYTIYRENFASEGSYRLGIYSKDRAGNEVNNLLKLNGEEVQFVVDNTMPRVVIDGVENNKIYDAESREICVVADDNFKLAEAELILVNGEDEILERWNYFDFVREEGDTAVITIGEHKEEVSLLYRAVDAAGNEIKIQQGEKEAKEEFLVTTDKLVQLVNKPTQTPVGRLIMIAATLFATGLMLIGLAVKIA